MAFMKIDWIDPNILAAGSIPFGVDDIYSLHEQDIKVIVSLTSHPLTVSREITPLLFDELGMIYYHSPIRDHYPPSHKQARKILQFIEQQKAQSRKIFIHCHAGVGRTGTMLHAYFLGQSLSLSEAKSRVKSTRVACTLLSPSQWAFLRRFAKEPL